MFIFNINSKCLFLTGFLFKSIMNFNLREYYKNFIFKFQYTCLECKHNFDGVELLNLERDEDMFQLKCCYCKREINFYYLVYKSIPNSKLLIEILSLYLFYYLTKNNNDNDLSYENFRWYFLEIMPIIKYMLEDNDFKELFELKESSDLELYVAGLNDGIIFYDEYPSWYNNEENDYAEYIKMFNNMLDIDSDLMNDEDDEEDWKLEKSKDELIISIIQ